MFGCCVAGRLLQTNLIQVDETHAYFELPNASTINHVCVFLLGTVPFPDGFGAAVHFFWPGKGFQLLGVLSNEKPSAIFRLKGTYSGPSSSTAQNKFSSYSSVGPDMQQDVTAILGLSIEPISTIQQQLEQLPSALASTNASPAKDPTMLAERIVKHLFNYISGFVSGGPMSPDVAIPMSVIQRWYEMFISKVRAGGVGFLERGD
ncbi:Protein OPI10-like protein [Psilocybe cubensis]|uniref:Hikeshi-like domain-containing protein n=2 Tax=Psilocybe cubensis TaxID=181762 RepID=A0A8H7XU55_PSICU|nr:Protein OPI10-like protein [Psilocybe cubensis]KAH9474638.1 Protein OPI10-like protein [Psilocybe cubensis]